MHHMQRLTVSLSDPTYRWLQREAKRADIGIVELIRRLTDQLRADAAASSASPSHEPKGDLDP